VLAGEAADEMASGATAGGDEVAQVVADAVLAPDQEPTRDERDRHVEDTAVVLATALRLLRHFIVQNDTDDLPFARVVGRVVAILTGPGGRGSCTVMPIAATLLLLLREHLDPEHRQVGRNRQSIDVTEPNLQGVLYDRLTKLRSRRWGMLQMASTGRGYQLTEDGRFVFNAWPEDIAFDPGNADLWKKKDPSTSGGR
jgi:hypothetical protein